MTLRSISIALAGMLLLSRATPCFAAKTDIVELLNGDRVTCEISKLERGKLTVKTDGLGTVAIEWDDVASVTSAATYDIELESGQRYQGSLARIDPKAISVVTLSGPERLTMDTVIRITPLKGSFWRRLDGSIDAGFNFTQANVQTQWTLATSVSYRGRLWLSALTGDSSLTTREDADRQTRNSVSLQTERLLGRRWSAIGFSQFQQNEELSLNLRTVFGGGIQRVLSQSNRTALSAVAGVAQTSEQYAGAEDENVAEAVAAMTWDWFTFDGRSTNLHVGVTTFYALAEPRTRLELNTTFKSDIVGDLYWSINLFESYNSAPPTGQKANDAGVSAAVGWSF